MLKTTMGQLLVNEHLPEHLRDYTRTIDKKSVKGLFEQLSQESPDVYRDANLKMHQLSGDLMTTHGQQASFALKNFQTPESVKEIHRELQAKIDGIMAGSGNQEDKNQEMIKLVTGNIDRVTKANYEAGLKEGNPLAIQVSSGSRGNPSQFRSLRGGDMLVVDHKDRPIPIPIFRSFSEGLDPVQYWAGAYGARKGSIATKFCVSSKTLVLMSDFSVMPIVKIRAGMWVMGADKAGKMFPVRVLRRIDSGKRVCYSYVFRCGQTSDVVEITGTPDHEILSKLKLGHSGTIFGHRSWYEPRLSKLACARKDYFAVPSQGFLSTALKDEPRALFLGLMLGAGCMAASARGQLSFSCTDPLLIEETANYFSGFNLELRKANGGNYNYTVCEIQRSKFGWNPKTRGCKTGNKNKLWLSQIGATGKRAWEKSFPNEVMTWSNQSISELLGGLFSTDGSVYSSPKGHARITLCLTSKKVIEQTRELLRWRFGIYTSSLTKVDTKNKQWAKHDQWHISIAHSVSVARFFEHIKLVGKKRFRLEEIAQKITANKKQVDISFPFDRKVSVGRVRTYDLEVDCPDHLFVLANGLVISNSTPKSGYLGKQLSLASHRLMITEKNCGTTNGILVPANDMDNEGAVLATNVGKYPAGTILSPRMLKELGDQNITVRSPMTCQADQGLCQHCAGVRERGGFSPIGDNIGLAAAQAISEPIGQGQLATKHGGGQAGGTSAKSGLDLINQLVSVPTNFQGAAAIAQHDGRVMDIADAPQGGKDIVISGQSGHVAEHHVPVDQAHSVKKGDEVEAGDVMSNGVPNPAQIAHHKGIGEGRRYFMDTMRKALNEGGFGAHRRNIELLSRGLVNHVRVTDLDGPNDTLPDDVTEYDNLARDYQPRYGFKAVHPKNAVGLYLEEPALHYSIGTRVTPRVAKTLGESNIESVKAHVDKPSFVPEMTRAMETLAHSDDWMVRMGGLYGVKRSVLKSVHRTAESNDHSTSYIPSLAKGLEFGKDPSGKGY